MPGVYPGALWPPMPPGYVQSPLRTPYSQRPPFRPGFVFCAVTALVVSFGIVGASGSDLGYIEGICVSIGALTGVVWLIALIATSQDTHLRYDRRSWVRWAIPPAIFFAGLTVMGSGVPATVRFDLSEPALQQSATQISSDTGYGPRWIGLYEFYDVRTDGPLRFFDLTLPGDESGQCSFTYAPQDTGDFDNWINSAWNVQSLGQSWWYGCEGSSSYGGGA